VSSAGSSGHALQSFRQRQRLNRIRRASGIIAGAAALLQHVREIIARLSRDHARLTGSRLFTTARASRTRSLISVSAHAASTTATPERSLRRSDDLVAVLLIPTALACSAGILCCFSKERCFVILGRTSGGGTPALITIIIFITVVIFAVIHRHSVRPIVTVLMIKGFQ